MTWDRDLGAEPPPAGDHQEPSDGPGAASAAIASAPEHDWGAATAMLFAVLRPSGTHGMPMAEVDVAKVALEGMKSHSQPLLDDGPADLVVAYVLRTPGFDILVNADHLVSWHVEPEAVRTAATANLRTWSKDAAWTDELSGTRRLLASGTGDGGDAARILLPEVRDHLAAELGGEARVLVGLPHRDLLVAGSLRDDDADFAGLFGAFVADLATDADEPIDPRIFELVDGALRPLEAAAA